VSAVPDLTNVMDVSGKYVIVECDISDREMVRKAVDTVHMDDDLPEWHRVIDVDLNGPVNMTHAVGNKMRADKRGGIIINISSVGGARCSGSREMPMVGYVAAKAAINQVTISWAIEFAEYGIRVNCIMPGPTHSRLDDQLTPEMRERNARTVLDGRYGEPIEIGALCVFFASAEGAHLNGVVMPHDGGYLCVN
jgi:NAD(P)-dependent dehydrogenase (short-subunit alcohol dehydrogenase family)